MAAVLREVRDPLGWGLAIATGLVNLALRVSPLKAAGVAVVVLIVKIGSGLVWPRPTAAPAEPRRLNAPPTPGLPWPWPKTARVEPPRLKVRPIPGGHLTKREIEVASFTPLGLSNKEIGKKLVPQVRERGVDKHIANIMFKLKVHSREEIAAWYVRNGADEKL